MKFDEFLSSNRIDGKLKESFSLVGSDTIVPKKPEDNKKRKIDECIGDTDADNDERNTEINIISTRNNREMVNGFDRTLATIGIVFDGETTSIEKIKEQVLAKQKVIEENKEHKLLAEQKSLKRQQQLLLPSLCDTIRKLFRYKNSSKMKYETCIRELKKNTTYSLDVLKATLALLLEVVPEFIMIVPADEDIPFTIVRINLNISYETVRSKLVEASADHVGNC